MNSKEDAYSRWRKIKCEMRGLEFSVVHGGRSDVYDHLKSNIQKNILLSLLCYLYFL